MTSIHTPVVLWCWVGLWIASHSRLYINGPSESGRLRDVCVCQWVNESHYQLNIYYYIILKCFVPDYPDYAAANYEEGNYEDTTVKYEQDEDRYRDGEEENETNARNYNNEYEGEDYWA